ncbi:hypothetical protein ACLOJK_006745 [Asimina triloba]
MHCRSTSYGAPPSPRELSSNPPLASNLTTDLCRPKAWRHPSSSDPVSSTDGNNIHSIRTMEDNTSSFLVNSPSGMLQAKDQSRSENQPRRRDHRSVVIA